jgi:orotate phosphoribosyltransferase
MTLRREEIIRIFKETGALLEGHFQLTSGLHSSTYFQCAKVFQYPWHAETLCGEIAKLFHNEEIDVIVTPAIGGIVVGQEIARILKVRSIFTERIDGKMRLRRGFAVSNKDRVLVAEDVTTTGGSVKEVLETIEGQGCKVVAVTAIVDRSGGKIDFGKPYLSLLQMDVVNYQSDDCPMCKDGSSVVKPGSRGIS